MVISRELFTLSTSVPSLSSSFRPCAPVYLLLLAIPTVIFFTDISDTMRCLMYVIHLILCRNEGLCECTCKLFDIKSNKFLPRVFFLYLFSFLPLPCISLLSLPYHPLFFPLFFPPVYPSLHCFPFHARPVSACYDMAWANVLQYSLIAVRVSKAYCYTL